MPKLTRNSVRCKKCNIILISRTVHDFQSCPCGVFVDGGLDYSRGGWPGGSYDDWVEDLCVFEPLETSTSPENGQGGGNV